jgi:CheY-like chemotaxis protein
MDETVKPEIRKIALGYELKYKISNMRMETYLAPAYVHLKKSHSELRFEEFIKEVVKVRKEERARAQNHILWVDDHPENNACWRTAFEDMGFQFKLALSTNEAFERLSQAKYKYVAIISDMDRREGPREGYVLLDRLREEGDCTPLFFFAASSAPEHKFETYEHGGQGCTNNPQELFEMVTGGVVERRIQ